MTEPEAMTDDELTVLAIGCSDGYEGPHFTMPRGDMVFLKGPQLVWMARRIKALERAVARLDPCSPGEDV